MVPRSSLLPSALITTADISNALRSPVAFISSIYFPFVVTGLDFLPFFFLPLTYPRGVPVMVLRIMLMTIRNPETITPWTAGSTGRVWPETLWDTATTKVVAATIMFVQIVLD
jgi:hypothetical protein